MTVRRGFTLIELLAVMAIVATLLTLAAPRYFDSLERAKEAALRADLRVIREAIDKHRSDTGRWPDSLEGLVQKRYLRSLPVDPITDRNDTWSTVMEDEGGSLGVTEIRSGAAGNARNGTPYSGW